MGCNCKKVTVAGRPLPAVENRTFFVDARGVREVTGMVLPPNLVRVQTGVETGRALAGQTDAASEPGPLDEAQNRYVVPGLLLGGAGGLALAKTVLAAHPFLAAAVGLGGGVWYMLSHLLDCGGPFRESTDPSALEVSTCESQGTVVGVALGAGAGLLLQGLLQTAQSRS